MKDFSSWGLKRRVYPENNYNAVWINLKTIRLGFGEAKELLPEHSEFYDVSLGTKCNLCCPFCYVGAEKNGRFYTDICEKAISFFGRMSENQKPFQIAIGSESEPTIHPDFLRFIKTIYDLGIVPNYTTNGITLAEDNDYSKKLLEYTEKYCAGVAVSTNSFNPEIDKTWRKAVKKLSNIDIHINLHLIISDKASVDKFYNIYNEYKDTVHTFVLLPIMPEGRSSDSCSPEVFEYFKSKWESVDEKHKVAFGANFYKYLKEQSDIKCFLFEPESFSKNLILDDTIKITASSFKRDKVLWSENYRK